MKFIFALLVTIFLWISMLLGYYLFTRDDVVLIPEDPATFMPWEVGTHIIENVNVVSLKGQINSHSVDEVIEALDKVDQPKTLLINSSGGYVTSSNKLIEYVYKSNIGTITTKTCLSACVPVLLSGELIGVKKGSNIGVHRPSNGKVLSVKYVTKMKEDLMKQYSRNLGDVAATELVNDTFNTPNNKVLFLSENRLGSYGVMFFE